MLVAQSAVALGAIPHSLNFQKFEIGVSGTLGETNSSKITLQNQDGSIKKLGEKGIAILPNFYVGANLGWLVSFWFNTYNETFNCPKDTECNYYYRVPFLSRFDVFASGSGRFKTEMTAPKPTPSYSTKSKSSFDSFGMMLRAHVIYPTDTFKFLGRWEGLTSEIGFLNSQQFIAFKFNDIFKYQNSLISYQWIGHNGAEYYASSKTVYEDISTGVNIFDWLEAYGGVGVFSTSGNVYLSLHRDSSVTRLDGKTTQYTIDANGLVNSSLKGDYYFLGFNVGYITLQGTRINKDTLNYKKAYSVSLGFSMRF